MNEQTASRLIGAAVDQVRGVLLEPLALADWNPAILSITGPTQAQIATRYPIVAKGGLRGTFHYSAIDDLRILTTIKVTGLEEQGWWNLEPRGDTTLVEHGFSHRGALALLLSSAFQGVAELRLDRLSTRSRRPPASSGQPPTPPVPPMESA
ncbi:hypothetical protein O7623_06565 [Solwaraspora sp. WMMD791]|uniref:SRPBCC family protein n=1 Tax=Solwaraspora sp. WMMD791 TaxID=3016086 RepID=UPI00249B766D|nr:SRPBCC family protein [Solwaraspora sp. WMMD791]WFE28847.1 hypothetical protein O7623_06565 [Solwaraspora sp. WMMD791]